MQSDPNHPNQAAWQFIGQALLDYAQTLQPSARVAFQTLAKQHYNSLADVVLAPVPKPSRKRGTKRDEIVADPGQPSPAA